MNWILPAIISPALYSFVIFIDKYIIEKKIASYWSMPIFTSIVGVLFGFIFWWIGDFAILPPREAFLILLVGVISLWGSVLYFKAIADEESSLIIILLQMHPAIVLILATTFLNEVITVSQLIGFVLVLGPAVILSLNIGSDIQKVPFNLSASFWAILGAGLLWSIGIIIFKPISQEHALITVVAFESWGLGIGGLIIYLAIPIIRNQFHESIRSNQGVLLFVLFNESLSVGAKLIGFLAFSLGPVALVSVLGSTQVFFGIILGVILTKFLPKIFNEDLSRATLTSKFSWSAIMLLGLWFIR